jgi:hypothetical protein
MPRRRITRRSLGAAAGGLLGVAFLPAAAAFADEGYDYGNYDLVPNSPDVVTDGGIRNFLVEVPPGAAGSVQGTQELVVDSPSGTPVGTIEVDVTNSSDVFDNTNQEILVTADLTGTPGSAAGDVPPVGSVFDTESYTSAIQAVYTNIPGAGANSADLISYSWDSAYGDSTIPTSYDAITTVVPVGVAGAGAGFTGDTFVLAGPETIEGINGIAPADYDLLGTQTFDVDNSAGEQIGTFTADVANSSDILGNTTQDMLVTSSTGDAPAVGSVYDYFFTGTAGSDSTYNVYSDIPSTDGGSDTITDTLVSPYGSSPALIDFDAASGLAGVLDGTSPLATGMSTTAFDITPDTSTSPDADATIVAIDGIQPEDIDVQGTEEFNWDPGTDQAGVFDADVAQSTIIFGNTTQEQLVVTQDVSGDAPQAGSVFEVYNYGDGFEQIYSDIVTNSGDEITDTTVTPFGDVNVPYDYDASAALISNSSENFVEAGLGAATLDPSAAVDPGSFAELFPQLDAALNLLTGLF